MKKRKIPKNKVLTVIIIAFFIILFKYNNVFGIIDIPKLYIEGNISEMYTKEDEREILIKYISTDVNFEQNAKIKIQGTSSLGYEKKNYTINYYEDNTYRKKIKVDVGKGWGAQSKYCLKANWIDKTHSRNIVSARIAAKVQDKYGLFTNTPNNGLIDGFPVEIYSNNEFLGLYTFNIPKSDWMWGLNEENPNNIALVGDDWTASVAFKEKITTFGEAKWELEVGQDTQETIDKFNRVIDFINNTSDEEFKKDFELYINKDAAFNYIIMLYVIEGNDNYGKNMIMLTYDGQVWYPSLYDLDSTWGTCSNGNLSESYNYIVDDAESKFLTRTIKNFSKELANRWFDLRKSILTKKNILNEFNSFVDAIPEEVYKKEKERWGEIPGYGIEQIEEYLDYRLSFIDNLMNLRIKENNISNEDKQNNSNLIYFVILAIIFVIIIILIRK